MGKVVKSACQIIEYEVKKNTRNFHVNIETDIPLIGCNAQQLEQVIINLVLNALKALPDRNCELSVCIVNLPHSEYIEIQVRDSGVGIPKELLARLNESFFTTRSGSGGTGLGLFICDSIVKELNGTMFFESELGSGTTVTIRLPSIH